MTLIPYILVAAYGLKLAWAGQAYATGERARMGDRIRKAVATLYAAGMIYAGGLKFLLLCSILHAPGTLLFFSQNANARRRTSAVRSHHVCGDHDRRMRRRLRAGCRSHLDLSPCL
jgi:arginine:ornithine antiporter / lysine permease